MICSTIGLISAPFYSFVRLEKSVTGVAVGKSPKNGLFSVYLWEFANSNDGDALENNPTVFLVSTCFYSYFLSRIISINAYLFGFSSFWFSNYLQTLSLFKFSSYLLFKC